MLLPHMPEIAARLINKGAKQEEFWRLVFFEGTVIVSMAANSCPFTEA